VVSGAGPYQVPLGLYKAIPLACGQLAAPPELVAAGAMLVRTVKQSEYGGWLFVGGVSVFCLQGDAQYRSLPLLGQVAQDLAWVVQTPLAHQFTAAEAQAHEGRPHAFQAAFDAASFRGCCGYAAVGGDPCGFAAVPG
jgi:hypothetical protein